MPLILPSCFLHFSLIHVLISTRSNKQYMQRGFRITPQLDVCEVFYFVSPVGEGFPVKKPSKN
jgi:hypothetical protein